MPRKWTMPFCCCCHCSKAGKFYANAWHVIYFIVSGHIKLPAHKLCHKHLFVKVIRKVFKKKCVRCKWVKESGFLSGVGKEYCMCISSNGFQFKRSQNTHYTYTKLNKYSYACSFIRFVGRCVFFLLLFVLFRCN